MRAELFDGTVLEFPDGTDTAVVQRVAREQTQRLRDNAARQPLPADVQPSNAGGGRGATGGPTAVEMAEPEEPQRQAAPRWSGVSGRGSAPTSAPIDAARQRLAAAEPSSQDAVVSPAQLGRDFVGGVEQVKALGEGVKAFGGSVVWREADNTLADMADIDRGGAPTRSVARVARAYGEPGPAEPTAFIRNYQAADPESRKQLRMEAIRRLKGSQEFIADSAKAIQAYQQEQQRLSGKMPEFTDIESAKGFVNWALRNSVATTPTMAAAMVGALFGPGGLAVSSGAMAVGDLTQGRVNAAVKANDPARFINPDRFDEASAGRDANVAAHLAANVDRTALLAVPYAAAEFLGPEGTLARQGIKRLAQGGAKQALVRGARALPGQMAQEAQGEGLQEVVNIVGEIAAGERSPELTGADAKRVANAAAVGAVVAPAGHSVNVAADVAASVRRPTEARKATLERFDDFAATHGIPDKAAKAVHEAAQGVPLAELPSFYKRATAALAKRGLIRARLDDAALTSLDEPAPAQPAKQEAVDTLDAGSMLGAMGLVPQVEQGAIAQAAQPEVPTLTDAVEQPAADLAGPPIDAEWTSFAPESGTKAIPRAEMPQIKAGDRSSMVQYLRARGIDYETDIEVAADQLKPTQAEFSPTKVQQAKDFTDTDRSILISSDGHVLDGHHQWLAKREAGEPIKAIRLNAPIDELLPLVREFPSAKTSEGATTGAPNDIAAPLERAAELPAQGGAAQGLLADGGAGDPRRGDAGQAGGVQDAAPAPALGSEPAAPVGAAGQQDAALTQRAERDYVLFRGPQDGGFPLVIDRKQMMLRQIAEADKPLKQDGMSQEHADLFKAAALKEARASFDASGKFTGKPFQVTVPGRGVYLFDSLQQAKDFAETTGMRAGKRRALTPASTQPAAPPPVKESAGKLEQATGPRLVAKAGRSPSATEDLTLRANADGTLTPYLGKNELLDFDSGEPIVLPADVTDEGVKKAIRTAGAVSSATVFYPATPKPKTPKAPAERPKLAKGERIVIGDKPAVVEKVTANHIVAQEDGGKRRIIPWDSPTMGRIRAAADSDARLSRDEARLKAGTAESPGLPLPALRQIAKAFSDNGLRAPQVVQSLADLPAGHRKRVEAKGADGVRGVYFPDTDETFLIADGLGSFEEAMFVAFHEAFHRGLRKTLGADGVKALRQIYATNRSVRERADKLAEEFGIDRDEATEEALADMAGEGRAHNLYGWKALMRVIRDWLSKIARTFGADLEFTDAMVEEFVAGMRKAGLQDEPQVLDGDDLGALLSRAQTETEAFKRWFGDSKVVDAEGKPLVVHHGTAADFSEFSDLLEKPAGDNFGRPDYWHYFSPDPDQAAAYAAKASRGKQRSGANVMPAYVKIENPLEVAPPADWDSPTGDGGMGYFDATRKQQRQAYFDGGHDGVIVRNKDGSVAAVATEYSSAIKSAIGNRGTFDPSNPDIRLSRKLPSDFVVVDGSQDLWMMPREIEQRTGGAFPPAPVRLPVGIHRGPNRGFGAAHIAAEHQREIDAMGLTVPQYVQRIVAGATKVYDPANGRLLVVNERFGRHQAVVELRDDGDHYSVVTAYQRRPEGKIVWSGRSSAASLPGGKPSVTGQTAPSGATPAAGSSAKPTAVRADDKAPMEPPKSSPSSRIADQTSDIVELDGDDAKLSRAAAVPTSTPTPSAKSGWRNDAGRFQLAPGQWLYDKMGQLASPLLDKLHFKAASPALRKQMRAMKLQVEKAQEVAVGVSREMFKMGEAERQLVSDLIEQELKAGIVPPAHAVKMADGINRIMDAQTNELVRLGMLSKETADEWRGKYLPRFYASKLKQAMDPWVKAVRGIQGKASPLRGIAGKSLHGRGLFETIPAGELADWQAMGWQVRDPDYVQGMPTVQVWRDFTRVEREQMGEIRDAGFRFVMGYMRTQKDIALGQMFERIAADPEMASRTEKPGWVKVPATEVPGTMGVKRYGKLAGRFVSAEVFDHLSKYQEADNAVLDMYRKGMGWWKSGKTAMNPVSHFNNIVSNVSMAHFAGVSYWHAHKYATAVADLVGRKPMVQEAKDAGLFLGTMSAEELVEQMPKELQALAKVQQSKVAKSATFVFDALTFFLRKPLSKAYQAEDLFFRYVIWRDARSSGMSAEEAVDYSQRFVFSYDDLPKGARTVRDTLLPFFSYTYKAAPVVLHTALTRPWRFLAPASVLWGINAASYALAAGDDDDDWLEVFQRYLNDPTFREKTKELQDEERANLPPWMKGATFLLSPKAIRLGMDEVTGHPLFMDVSRVVPLGDIFDINPNSGGVAWPQPLTPSHPLLTTFTGLFANKDLYFGKELTDSNDTAEEKATKRAAWIWKQLAPAIAVGNYHFERGLNVIAQMTDHPVSWWPNDATGIGRDGLPVQPGYAAMQTVGIKVRPVDLEVSEAIEGSKREQMIRQIDTEIKALVRLNNKGALSDAQLDRERERAQLKKERIREGLTVDGEARD